MPEQAEYQELWGCHLNWIFNDLSQGWQFLTRGVFFLVEKGVFFFNFIKLWYFYILKYREKQYISLILSCKNRSKVNSRLPTAFRLCPFIFGIIIT